MIVEIFSILFGAVVATAFLTLLLGIRARSQASALDETRMFFSAASPTLEDVELSRPFGERVITPAISSLLAFLSHFAPQQNLQEIKHKLEIAGRPYGWTVTDFMGLRLLAMLLTGVVFFALFLLSDLSILFKILLTVATCILGFYLPMFWLNWRIGQRKSNILRALPDGLDMLNICVSAGLGFNAALVRVGQRWNTPLADEFNRVVAEIQLGKSRHDALLGMAERTDLAEVENFVATIVQADQLGVSIAKVLRTQAEQMRIARRQRAEELARKATIKLLFPLVFLIFPAMLAVLLGPAVPQVIRSFSNLGQ